jgi:hypothetical protein
MKKSLLVPMLWALSVLSCASSGQVTVQLITPTTGATVTSPVAVQAAAISSTSITGWRIYVDGTEGYRSDGSSSISASLPIAPGNHSVTVKAWTNGRGGSATTYITVGTVGTAPQPVSVTISPTTASVQSGTTQQFAAGVTGTSNTSVTWSVNGVQGGNSTVGTVSSAGLYTAPATVPSGGSVTLTATSVYDSTRSASAIITVLASATPVSVSISPTTASVQAGQTKQFAATVSGTTTTSVTWFVSNVQGGNSTVGTVSSSGLYTAPSTIPSGGSVNIKAQSASDITKSAIATVTITASASAALHYYVSTTGSDSNNGSQASPWRTMQHAADNLALGNGGTIVHVAPGTYSDTTYCSTPYVNTTAMVCVTKSGTAAQPISFVSDQRWQAKLTCATGNPFFVLGASYIKVVGFEMTCPGGTFAAGTYGNYGHNGFYGNYFHDFATSSCPSTGVLFGVGSNSQAGWTNNVGFVADGNVIRHVGAVTSSQPQCNQMHAIYFSEPYDVVTNNVISGVVGYGIVLYGGGVCHETIANNTVFNNSQGGIRVENVGAKSGYWDECGNGASTDYNTVVNNISVNNGTGRAYGGSYYTGQGYGIDSSAPIVGTHNVYSNNLLYGNAPGQYSLGSGETAINAKTGTDTTVFVSFQVDSYWAPAPGYNYQNYALRSGSPAIDSGSASAPPIDINGGVRPYNALWDIGAFEFGALSTAWPWQ